jgi:hypothetical protein
VKVVSLTDHFREAELRDKLERSIELTERERDFLERLGWSDPRPASRIAPDAQLAARDEVAQGCADRRPSYPHRDVRREKHTVCASAFRRRMGLP